MAQLRPCDGCLRHVRGGETRCPFCDHELAPEAHGAAATPTPLGRAARMAFGAAVATASIAAACGGGNKPPETGTTGVTTEPMADAAPAPTTTTTTTATQEVTDTGPLMPNVAKPYGAPPADGLLV